MKKTLILFGAVPLLCGAVGFGAGTVLKREPMPHVAAETIPPQPDATDVLQQLADHAPATAPEPAPPVLHEDHDDGANHTEKAEHQVAEAAPKTSHGKPHGVAAETSAHEKSDAKVVKVGRISVPVYKPNSVTYVIAEFGVEVEDEAQVAHYSIAENATRLRDAILTSMHRVAETPMLKGPAIDSDKLADAVATDLKPNFDGVREVLFLTLHKTDVPRT